MTNHCPKCNHPVLLRAPSGLCPDCDLGERAVNYKYLVMVKYRPEDTVDTLSVWDTEEDAHQERKRMEIVGSQSNLYWVRQVRYNAEYHV